jgi:hypothetical protein
MSKTIRKNIMLGKKTMIIVIEQSLCACTDLKHVSICTVFIQAATIKKIQTQKQAEETKVEMALNFINSKSNS